MILKKFINNKNFAIQLYITYLYIHANKYITHQLLNPELTMLLIITPAVYLHFKNFTEIQHFRY